MNTHKDKGELILSKSEEPDIPRSTSVALYGTDTPAGKLDQVPKTAYYAYISSLAKGSTPIAKSSLGRVSRYLYHLEPSAAPWHQMTIYHYNMLIRYLEEQGLAPKTIHRYISMVRSVLKSADILNMIPPENRGDYNAIMASKNIKGAGGRGEIRPHRSLTDDEISTLFGKLAEDESPGGLRDMAILSIMRGCGLRRMEVVDLLIDQIRWAAGVDGELLILKGKGGKTRMAPMPPGLRDILGRWVEVRGDELGPLFCAINRGGRLVKYGEKDVNKMKVDKSLLDCYRPLDRSSVNRMMSKRLIYAGIDKATPHDLRYTFAQKNLERSDMQTVADLMGHSNISTTSIYTETSKEKMAFVTSKETVFTPFSSQEDNS